VSRAQPGSLGDRASKQEELGGASPASVVGAGTITGTFTWNPFKSGRLDGPGDGVIGVKTSILTP